MGTLARLAAGRLSALTSPPRLCPESLYRDSLFRGDLAPELLAVKTRLESYLDGSGLAVLVMQGDKSPYISIDGTCCTTSASQIRQDFKQEIDRGQIYFVSANSRIFAPYF